MNPTTATVIPLDPINVLAAFAAGWIAGPVAYQASAYAVIVGCALLGAILGLRIRPDSAGMHWSLRVASITGVVTLCGAGVTYILERVSGYEFGWLVGPVCVVLALLGDDWIGVAKTMLDFVLRRKADGGVQ